MAALSPKLRSVQGGWIGFWCPGCDSAHVVLVESDVHPVWSWNKDVNAPTLSPSILVTYDGKDVGQPGALPAVCHSFVEAGQIRFLGDCTHALAGRTVPLPDWPSDFDDGSP